MPRGWSLLSLGFERCQHTGSASKCKPLLLHIVTHLQARAARQYELAITKKLSLPLNCLLMPEILVRDSVFWSKELWKKPLLRYRCLVHLPAQTSIYRTQALPALHKQVPFFVIHLHTHPQKRTLGLQHLFYCPSLYCSSQVPWFVFFNKLKVCGSPVSSKSIGSIFSNSICSFC